MNIPLTDELEDFVRKRVASGAFASEKAVLEEAVRRFRQEHEGGYDADGAQNPATADLIDYDAIEYCAREVAGKDIPSIEEVRRTLSKITGSMARAVIEEREDRI